MSTKTQKGFIQIIIILVVLALIGGIYYFVTKNKQNILEAQNSNPSPYPTADWKTYTNIKYGFELKYPDDPKLTPREVNIKQDYEDYSRKCKDGTYDGCGGSRWPDYKITFFRENGKGAFDVSIWKGEEISKYLSSIPHNGYSYSVSTFRSFDEDGEIDPLDENTIKQIYSTLKFLK